MLERGIRAVIEKRLEQFPAVALLGPRQVGKTTLALEIGRSRSSVYLDLESDSDRAKLQDPELYLADHKDKLVILDEVHRLPNLFRSLRGIIDQGRREGRTSGQFLLLGSAAIDLLRQSGESLAGRIAFVEMPPILVSEVEYGFDDLWLRGGFPESFLAQSDEESLLWRQQFIRTYLERDIPDLGPRIPAETLRRFWSMLAHHQGSVLNAASLARGLAVDGKTVARYLDLLVDLLLVRRLPPIQRNIGKRLVKSPKAYIRDSGVLHALLGQTDRESLLGHPIVGMSWEGFVIENILDCCPERTIPSFYRSSGGAEVDLVLEFPSGKTFAIEIKRGLSPKIERGFYHALEDVDPDQGFVVYSGTESYRVSEGIEMIGIMELLERIKSIE